MGAQCTHKAQLRLAHPAARLVLPLVKLSVHQAPLRRRQLRQQRLGLAGQRGIRG